MSSVGRGVSGNVDLGCGKSLMNARFDIPDCFTPFQLLNS